MRKQSPDQFAITSWTTHAANPAELGDRILDLGLKKVQLYLVPVYRDAAWSNAKAELSARGISVVSGMFGTAGEDYTSLDTIRKTGGFIPDQHWEENWKTVQAVAKTARAAGVSLVSTHAGFLPSDPGDPSFAKLVERIGQVASHFATHALTLVFETGQETADTLDQFLSALAKQGATNTGVNFDPANMILYDKGDPIKSLRKLMPRVRQVHIKDAVRTKTPGTWGTEVPIGEGQVDWKAFMEVLAQGDYAGNLVVEREAGADRAGDVRKAIERLGKLM